MGASGRIIGMETFGDSAPSKNSIGILASSLTRWSCSLESY